LVYVYIFPKAAIFIRIDQLVEDFRLCCKNLQLVCSGIWLRTDRGLCCL